MNPDRSAVPNPVIGRRRLLRNGGIVVSLSALMAACGDDRTGLEEPGRVGFAPPPDPLPDTTVNDVVLLRTAQSVEYTAIEVYDIAAGLGVLDASTIAVVNRFVDDHNRHADAVGGLITQAGGEEFTCANPWFMDRVIAPILAAVEGSDDVRRDVLNIAHALESLAAATYQDVVGSLGEPELRRAAMINGADEARHAATLAMLITGTPAGYVSPELLGLDLEPDASGFPVPYAIPSTFGQVGSSELVVGARRDDGSRFSILLQTPAENSFVYEYMTCE
jgi:rubrerythrin